jgi:hypothetical protein
MSMCPIASEHATETDRSCGKLFFHATSTNSPQRDPFASFHRTKCEPISLFGGRISRRSTRVSGAIIALACDHEHGWAIVSSRSAGFGRLFISPHLAADRLADLYWRVICPGPGPGIMRGLPCFLYCMGSFLDWRGWATRLSPEIWGPIHVPSRAPHVVRSHDQRTFLPEPNHLKSQPRLESETAPVNFAHSST